MQYKLKEKNEEPVYEKIKAIDYWKEERDYQELFKDYWWRCSKCNILFSPDEEVILKTHKGSKDLLCPICKSWLSQEKLKWFKKNMI